MSRTPATRARTMAYASGCCPECTAPCAMPLGGRLRMPTPRWTCPTCAEQEKYSAASGGGLRGVRAAARAGAPAGSARSSPLAGDQVRSPEWLGPGRVRPVGPGQPLGAVDEAGAVGALAGRGSSGSEGVPHGAALPQEEPARVAGDGAAAPGRVSLGLPAGDRPRRVRSVGATVTARPEEPILDAASSRPAELDLFRLAGLQDDDHRTERFVETARRLGYEQDIAFRELPVR